MRQAVHRVQEEVEGLAEKRRARVEEEEGESDEEEGLDWFQQLVKGVYRGRHIHSEYCLL
jgi:hypothetical protein